ncbi:MAG TPA: hypothetical protein VGG33_05355 [Polyangia bacterium]
MNRRSDEQTDGAADSARLWALARPNPLSPEALRRVGRRLQADERLAPRGPLARRWSLAGVGAVATLLLLIGGVAGASVYSWVLTRQHEAKTRASTTERLAVVRPVAQRAEVPPPPLPFPSAPATVVPTQVAESPRTPPRRPKLAARASIAGATRPEQPKVVVAPIPESAPEEPLATEARLLASALRALRQEDAPGRALSLLDEYGARFPEGTLADEALLARVDGLRRLSRTRDLLALLDGTDLAQRARGRELRVLRGELRLGRERHRDAIADFSAILAANDRDPAAERALYGRAIARAAIGDEVGAQTDVASYLARFPRTARAEELRRRSPGAPGE